MEMLQNAMVNLNWLQQQVDKAEAKANASRIEEARLLAELAAINARLASMKGQ